jgi:uncharacterized protein (DUF302 family)
MTQHLSAIAGLEKTACAHSVHETSERFKELLAAKGIRLFAQIDHAAEAEKVGMQLRPTRVLVFGNPRAGTPLMQSQQSIALDLPLRVLIAEDDDGKVWIFNHRVEWLAKRHGIEDHDEAVTALDSGLAALAQGAAHAQNS